MLMKNSFLHFLVDGYDKKLHLNHASQYEFNFVVFCKNMIHCAENAFFI